jgi:hypothetical protein
MQRIKRWRVPTVDSSGIILTLALQMFGPRSHLPWHTAHLMLQASQVSLLQTRAGWGAIQSLVILCSGFPFSGVANMSLLVEDGLP